MSEKQRDASCALSLALPGMMAVRMRKSDRSRGGSAGTVALQGMFGYDFTPHSAAQEEMVSICDSPVWTVVTLSLFCQHRYASFVLRAPAFPRVRRIDWLWRCSFESNWIFFSKTLGWHHSSSTGTKTSAGLLFCIELHESRGSRERVHRPVKICAFLFS